MRIHMNNDDNMNINNNGAYRKIEFELFVDFFPHLPY